MPSCGRRARRFLALLALSSPVLRAGEPELVIYDNDWNVPGSYYEENALMPLLASPRVKVIGITSSTGDSWRDEGTVNVLRYLEVIGRPDIPVYNGAEYPLINTKTRMNRWEETYGQVYWKGAFNDPAKFANAHPDDPSKIIPPVDGLPKIKAQSEGAVAFLIRAVHEHPHQVTIFAGGALTDIALAIELDPEFSRLAKEFVFFGGAAGDLADGQSIGFHSDFDFVFDPEAAHICLAAHWDKIISVADVSNDFYLDQALAAKIHAHPSAAGEYLLKNSSLSLPVWGEVATSVIADPSLVTKSVEVTMDVDIDHGASYGRTIIGPLNAKPALGLARVTIIQKIDGPRFLDQLVKAIQTDVSRKAP